MIHLFTDFGVCGPYLGQMQAVLSRSAPDTPVISLLSDAPPWDPIRSAYLMAAYTSQLPAGDLVLGVVDPGVGGDRTGVILLADGVWYVGPDNGLFEIVAQRSRHHAWWLLPPPEGLVSVSFHGRDWFAPYAAKLATGRWLPQSQPKDAPPSGGHTLADDCHEIIYLDHYGNAVTGIFGASLSEECVIGLDNHRIAWARTFSSVPQGSVFWYVNANGLVELAANRARACDVLQLRIGMPLVVMS